MGVEGCAYATVIAQGISAVLCLVYIIKEKFDVLKLKKRDFTFSFFVIRKLLSLGVPMGLQFSITAIGTIIVQGAINVYGPVSMAGFSRCQQDPEYYLYGICLFWGYHSHLCRSEPGSGKMDRVRKGVYMTQAMILISSFVIMAVIYFLGKYMVLIFVDPSETDVIMQPRFILTRWPGVTLSWEAFIFTEMPFRGWATVWVPMMGGVFELIARWGIVAPGGRKRRFRSSGGMSDPAAWIAALIPLIPYYFWTMRKKRRKKWHKSREHFV